MKDRVVDRRTALQAITLAGAGMIAGPALLAGEAGAQTGTTPKKQEPAAAPAPEAPAEPSAEAKQLGDIAKTRYGKYMNEEQLKQLVEDMDGGLKGGERLRKLGLKNSDEPDFVFRAEP